MAVGAIFLVLTLFYNATIPLWESDYEWAHYQYVRFIATQHRLPAPDDQIAMAPTGDLCSPFSEGGLASVHQFRQPPLYYLLGSLALIGADVPTDIPVVNNPHLHVPLSQGGLNVAVHNDSEQFPYQGTVLAVHRVRALSGLIGLAGLVATYLSGLLLFPRRRHLAVAMMAINAFIPQYVFSASVVNNDILAGALGSWCVFLSLYFVLRRTSFVVLALAILANSLAILAKYSSLALIPVVGLAVLLSSIRIWRQDRSRWRRQVWQLLGVVALSALPMLVWMAHNRALTGHFLGEYGSLLNSFVNDVLVAPVTVAQGRLLDPLYAAGFVLMTLWGLFGNDNIALPQLVVYALQAVALVSGIGAVWVACDRRQPSLLRVAVVTALMVLMVAFLVNVVKGTGTSEPRGRYFLPVYSVISFLLVLGGDRMMPARWKPAGTALLPGALLALAIAIPPLLLRPAYAPPETSASTLLYAGEEPINAVFGDFAELLGYRIEPQRIGLYESVEVTLIWHALKETPNNYTVAVQLLDAANVAHDQRARFPGNGNLATSLWKPGDVFRDIYRVGLVPDARASLPSLGRIKVAMYCYPVAQANQLAVTDQSGNNIGDAVYLGRIKLAAPDDSATEQSELPPLYNFGDQIALEQFSLAPTIFPSQTTVTIGLQWRALTQPAHDYTVFARLVDSEGVVVAAYDLPLTGNYYPSGLWEQGESIFHAHPLPLDPARSLSGAYTLRIGLYDPQSGVRLPAVDIHGTEQPNGEVILRSLQVSDELSGRLRFLPLIWRDYDPESIP